MGFVKEFVCMNGHSRDVFEHTRDDLGTSTIICEECGNTMGSIFSPGHPMLYFEEGRTRTINNLGEKPVEISSYRQYENAKRKRGVENAGAIKGGKGSWV